MRKALIVSQANVQNKNRELIYEEEPIKRTVSDL